MATATVTVISTLIASSTSSAPSATPTGDRATPQAGVLEGASPVAYDAKNPIQLFMVQAALIIVFCRLLHFPLKYLGQPRVIAEVIGGIILGPSVMGHIPHFKDAIFPTASMPVLNNAANLGLIIFLFLTALEVDLRMFKRNWKVAVSVGILGMILSFGLGVAIAVGLYNHFNNEDGIVPIGFATFALFVGTALAITAFPVLCRILTELELLGTSVGVTVLAAGVGNDVVGWILLALCVALVNNANGLAALWALLCCVGWILFLVFAVKPVFHWILRRNGSLQNGPTQGTIGLTILLVFVSAWFTGIIGVHPIFGGFLVGLICPHESGFAIKLTEKIEDFVGVIFLPLYFALSGLNTDLGLLNDGMVWAYVVGVTAVAFFGKIVGGTLAARFNGLIWRESFTIGVLMSCKGLVELIVLNIGLQAKILSQRTFTLFVVMAVVTTVATTPLTNLLYPKWYQHKLEKWKRGEIDWDGNPLTPSSSQQASLEKLNQSQIHRLLVYLRLDSLPSLFTFISLVGQASAAEIKPIATSQEEGQETQQSSPPHRPLEVHGLRILELTERTSSVMQVSDVAGYSRRDPIVNTFKTFSQLNNLAAAGQVVVAPSDSYAETLTRQASEISSDFALIPWSEIGSVTEDSTVPAAVSEQDRFNSRTHLDFVQKVLAQAVCNTGIFINNGFGGQVRAERPTLHHSVSALSIHSVRAQPASLPVADKTHHIFFPFFGGVDDRVALRFVLQLAKNTNVNATICRFDLSGEEADITRPPEVAVAGSSAISPRHSGSRVATGIDNVKTVEEATAQDLALFSSLQSSLSDELSSRVTFMEVTTHAKSALGDVVTHAKKIVGKSVRNAGDLVVVGRRHTSFGDPTAAEAGHDFRGTVGAVGEWVATSGVKTSVLVIQAGGQGLQW